ncbi:MAG TPA: OmpA family protein [Candidatus Deferrimicrobiaceae bacterium]|nr:OmpA family protein [Candidatus Deferrimicrobiaceae bacterium]
MASRAALAALALLLLVGCAKPMRDDLYVLMPDQEGKTGVLAVESGGQQAVLDRPYASARVAEPGRVQPGTVSELEARQAFGAALGAQPARPASFILYFLEGRDELTPDSRAVLTRILDEIARRPAPEIVVIGHTDRVGAVPFNDALSLRRAERVRDELVNVGIAADRIRVAGRGEREPLVPTADEVAEARNRRVEINVR